MKELLAIVACLALGASAACEPKVAGDGSESAREKPASVTPSKPAPERQVKPTAAECTTDRQCSGYLRCEEGECVVPPAVDGRVYEGMPIAKFESDGEVIAEVKLELAVEPWEMTRGLMYRRKMHPDFGMLFVYPDEGVRSFWMKNTYLSLDMVHLDGTGEVVGVISHVEPMTTTSRRTGEPARYVLELLAGRADELGIVEGVRMRLENVPDHVEPSENQ